MRISPSAGAVGAPWFNSGRRRSLNQRISFWPEPTFSVAPTIFRTIFHRKPSARMSKMKRPSLSLISSFSTLFTVPTLAEEKFRKSCSPKSISAASSIRSLSRPGCQRRYWYSRHRAFQRAEKPTGAMDHAQVQMSRGSLPFTHRGLVRSTLSSSIQKSITWPRAETPRSVRPA